MKKLSFKQAAEKILSTSEEPLSARQITEKALENNLIETTGATPDATMAAQLYTEITKNPASHFVKVGKGMFALKKQKKSVKSPLLAIQNQNDLVRQRLVEKINAMDPYQFEFLIAELLRRIGYEEVEVTQRTGDKGIDIMANLTVGGLTDVKTVIQVKKYKQGNNIAGRHITQLRGSAEVDQRGLIITTSRFTKDAIRESKAAKKMPVALVNGQKLVDLLIQHSVGVKEELVKVLSIDSELFENELPDTITKGGSNKRKALWPLPGGLNSLIDTLDMLLEKVRDSSSSKDDLVKWFLDHFDSVTSIQGATGYVNVPKNMGLIHYADGVYQLTEDGVNYLNTKDKELLYKTISSNILAFDEVHDFLSGSPEPKTEQEILQYVVENFDVEWTTQAQVFYRLLWLMNLGKVEKLKDGYIGINQS